MNDSQNLIRILNEKKLSVKEVAINAGIPPTTLYSIIQRNGNIRLDLALRLARILDIQAREICSDDIIDYVKVEIIR
jgi:predicted transcriptional regulator